MMWVMCEGIIVIGIVIVVIETNDCEDELKVLESISEVIQVIPQALRHLLILLLLRHARKQSSSGTRWAMFRRGTAATAITAAAAAPIHFPNRSHSSTITACTSPTAAAARGCFDSLALAGLAGGQRGQGSSAT